LKFKKERINLSIIINHLIRFMGKEYDEESINLSIIQNKFAYGSQGFFKSILVSFLSVLSFFLEIIFRFVAFHSSPAPAAAPTAVAAHHREAHAVAHAHAVAVAAAPATAIAPSTLALRPTGFPGES
jgi:hypothetical protein